MQKGIPPLNNQSSIYGLQTRQPNHERGCQTAPNAYAGLTHLDDK